MSESNYFEKGWQHSYWGSNYPRLAEIKRKYDPDGLFFVHNGVGSEQWSADGFTKLSTRGAPLACNPMPGAGLEPARSFRSRGF